jgi:cell wall-associated NlpC family hydrolase
MTYAICGVPVAPIRLTPNHRVEMVSQLLFGECCIINDVDKNGWAQITCKADGYQGWAQLTHLQEISNEQYNETIAGIAADWVNEIEYNGTPMFISKGSLITKEKSGQQFKGTLWNPATAKPDEATIRKIAFDFLNTTYLWGGRSVFGIDCSGFAQTVYKFLNIPLLRDAKLQVTEGEIVGFLQEARCGDLAFFDEEGEIVHVGILLNEKEIIHSAGKVRIDKIDNQGIVNVDTGVRTHQLRIIKRYF